MSAPLHAKKSPRPSGESRTAPGPSRRSTAPSPVEAGGDGAGYGPLMSAAPALPVQRCAACEEGHEAPPPEAATSDLSDVQRQETTVAEEPEETPEAVQRAEPEAEDEPAPDDEPAGGDEPVQRACSDYPKPTIPAVQAAPTGAGPSGGPRAQQVAAQGVRHADAPLPGLSRLQAAFGRHDLSDVRVQVGGRAVPAARRLGAQAYTQGHRIAFRESPGLHLAAHEAAHVVQQRRGVHLKGGMSERDDPYERQANQVADAVVEGRSAEGILDTDPTGSTPEEHEGEGVQRCSCGGTCAKCRGEAGAEGEEEPVQRQLVVNATRQYEPGSEPAAGGEATPAGGGGAAEGEVEGEEGAEGAEGEAEGTEEGGDALDEAGAGETTAEGEGGGKGSGGGGNGSGGGGAAPAGAQPAGAQPGSAQPGGAQPGGAQPGGAQPGGAPGGAQPAAGGETAAAEEPACSGGGGATCYTDDTPEPEEEPEKKPEEPPAGKSQEQMSNESTEAEPEDNCPIEEAVNAESAAAAPPEGVAAAAGAPGAGAAPAESGALGSEAGAAPGGAGPEAGAAPGGGGGGGGGGTSTAAGGDAPSPLEASIAAVEGQRSQAVSAYAASSARLGGVGQRVGGMAGSVAFAVEPGATGAAEVSRRASRARAESFFAGTAARVEAVRSRVLHDIPFQIGGLAEAIKAGIGAGIEGEKAAISARIAAARSQASADAAAARQETTALHAATVSVIQAQSAAALAMLTAGHAGAMPQIDARETAGLDTINELYATSKTAHEAKGPLVGAEAVQKGQGYVDTYDGCKKCASDGTFTGHLTDRRAQAQQNAAVEVTKGFTKNLNEIAKEQARTLNQGKPKDRCGVIAAARRARGTLDDQLDGLTKAVERAQTAAMAQADSTRDGLLAQIESGLASTLAALDAQERTQRQAANDTGYLQQVAVEQAAHASVAAVQDAVAGAIEGLEGGLEQIRGALSGKGAPDPEALDGILSAAEGSIGTALDGLEGQADQGAAAAEARLFAAHAEALSALAGVTSANDEQAAAVSGGFTTGMVALRAGASSTFGEQMTTYTTTTLNLATEGVAGFNVVVSGFDQSVTAITTNVGTTLKDSEAKLEKSLRDKLPTLDCEIPKQATLAAAKEAPAWKTVVAVILIIAIIIVVALVIGPAVIAAAGAAAAALGAGAAAGTIGLIVGGAIVGAASSALITVIQNWSTNQSLGKGVAEAAFWGAVGGAIGGAIAAGGSALIGQGASRLTQFAAGVVGDALSDVATQLIQGHFTGQEFSWRDFGKAIAMSIVMNGLGGTKGVRRIQARWSYRGGRLVPGQKAKAFTENARVSAEQELGPLFDKPGAKGGAKPAAPPEAPAAPRSPEAGPEPAAPRAPEAEPAPRPVEPPAPESTPTRQPGEGPEGAPARPATEPEGGPSKRPGAPDEPETPRSAHPDEPELEPGVVAKHSTGDGHEVKVLEDGRIILCSDSCGDIRLKYGDELKANPEFEAKLKAIEGEADPKVKAREAAKLRAEIEQKVLKDLDPKIKAADEQTAQTQKDAEQAKQNLRKAQEELRNPDSETNRAKNVAEDLAQYKQMYEENARARRAEAKVLEGEGKVAEAKAKRAEAAEWDAQATKLKAEIDALNAQVKAARDAEAAAKKKAQDLERDLATSRNDALKLKEQRFELETAAIHRKTAALRKETIELQGQVKTAKEKAAKAAADMAEAQKRVTEAQNAAMKRTKNVDEINEATRGPREEVMRAKQAKDAAEAEVKRLNAELEAKTKAMEEGFAEVNQKRTDLEAEQQAAEGVSPELYKRLRGKTPDTKARAKAQAETEDAIYGRPINGTPEADHIIPMHEIVRMPGFNELTEAQQIAVLNHEGNFWALDKQVNASKGHRTSSNWGGHPDFGPIPPKKLAEMKAREAKARQELQDRIDSFKPKKPTP